MNPVDLIFGAVSNLTGGLIIDMTTAICGVLTLMFIDLGFTYLKGIFLNIRERNRLDATGGPMQISKSLSSCGEQRIRGLGLIGGDSSDNADKYVESPMTIKKRR